MSNITGLDIEAVRELSRNLKSQGSEIDNAINAIQTLVGNIPNIWHGKDSQEFVGWWEQQHKPALIKVRDHVNGLGDSAMANANDQEQVSNH